MSLRSVNRLLFLWWVCPYRSQEFQGPLAQCVLIFCLFGFLVWGFGFCLFVLVLFVCFNPGLESNIFLGNFFQYAIYNKVH